MWHITRATMTLRLTSCQTDVDLSNLLPVTCLTETFNHLHPLWLHPLSFIYIFSWQQFITLLLMWCRFDLLANGGASLTLSFERAPFLTQYRTVWVPWNVFYVMDTLVMKKVSGVTVVCLLVCLVTQGHDYWLTVWFEMVQLLETTF